MDASSWESPPSAHVRCGAAELPRVDVSRVVCAFLVSFVLFVLFVLFVVFVVFVVFVFFVFRVSFGADGA
ncbi:hypothetical protein [Streptomyces sp. NBC_00310]|uniref:hypothetical protein n=1 Tax=Streptomyces sp. NBC_00310 TaxID=2903645 RepID=UPI002E238BCD